MATRPDEEVTRLRPFNDEVRIEKGNQLAELNHEIAALEAEAKRISAGFKEEIEKRKAAGGKLVTELRSGKHYVPVQAEWRMTRDGKNWQLLAEDNKEIIRTEPTTMADRQAELQLS